MDKVYVVEEIDYEGGSIIGIFTDKERAQEVVDWINKDKTAEYIVTEWNANVLSGELGYAFIFNKKGKLKGVKHIFIDINSINTVNEHINTYYVHVKKDIEEKALKKAKEILKDYLITKTQSIVENMEEVE